MHRRLIAIVAVASIAIVACGGDDSDAPAAAAETTPTSAVDRYGSDTTDVPAAPDAAPSDVPATSPPAGEGSGALIPGDPTTGKPEVQLPKTLPLELVVTDLIEGTGDAAQPGDTITANYVGVLTADGQEFDSSYDSSPISLQIGTGRVIPGFDQGLLGVKAGGRRQLDIPADLAYGEAGAGNVIPPWAPITFVVDVISVEKPPPPPTLAPMADPAECPAPDGSSAKQQEFSEYPPTCIDVTRTYTAEIVTNVGTLVVALDAVRAPLAVNNFVVLARYHYFDDTICHRIVRGVIAQCGDPTASGAGGPGYRFADELPASGDVYVVGAVSMANAGSNTNGSQFFVMTGDAQWLPPDYTYFGNVIEGMDTTLPAIDAAGNPDDNGGPPLSEIRIQSVTITES